MVGKKADIVMHIILKNRKEADEWLDNQNIHAKELSFEKSNR